MLRLASVVCASAFAFSAGAQCVPAWDYSLSVPGAPSGYVGALATFQGDLIASGSFTSMGGVANTQYLARFNRSAGAWEPMGGGIGAGISNAFGTSFAEFGGDLYVGGFFAETVGVPGTKSIARWDGTDFHSLGTGWGFETVNAVWSLLATDAIGGQNRLYIGGGFDAIAGQPAGCIASWDGTTLTPLASSMTLVGINPLVTCMAVFDDEQGGGPQLYIGGRFSAVNGVPANMIARWNGSTWSAVGTNLAPRNAAAEIDAMLVHDDGTGAALYVGGTNLRLNGDGINRATAKWNGTTWTAVGQPLTGRTWSLVSFDDGTGSRLYAGGTQAAVGYFYRLEGGTWTAVGGGAGAQVVKLLVEGNRMHMGGSFTTAGGQTANRIAARTSCIVVCGCAADFNDDGGVDGADVSAFFEAWESSTGCSDVNDDGGIDGSDVSEFFSLWESGGC